MVENTRRERVGQLRDAAILPGTPVGLQLAREGCWEEALGLGPGDPPWTEETLFAWAGESTDLALEVLFRAPGGRLAFLGIRFPLPQGGGTETGHSVPGFLFRRLAACAEAFRRFTGQRRPKGTSGERPFLTAFHGTLDGPLFPEGMLAAFPTEPPDFLEVGVFNQWRSAGSCILWRRGEPPLERSALRRRLEEHSRLLRPFAAPVMLEIARRTPVPAWLGVQVSRKGPEGECLSEAMLLRVLRRLGL